VQSRVGEPRESEVARHGSRRRVDSRRSNGC
jgi:hypothetical protein